MLVVQDVFVAQGCLFMDDQPAVVYDILNGQIFGPFEGLSVAQDYVDTRVEVGEFRAIVLEPPYDANGTSVMRQRI